SEYFQEPLCGSVEHGAADVFGAADDLDKVELAQTVEHLAGGDAADRFDVGAGDGLFVCDDGERLKGGGGEARVLVTLAQAAKPGVVLGQRQHLIAAG